MYHSWSGIQQQVFHPYLPGISMWVGRLLHYDRCSERLAKLSCHHHFARELGLFENSDIDQQHNNQKTNQLQRIILRLQCVLLTEWFNSIVMPCFDVEFYSLFPLSFLDLYWVSCSIH